MSAPAAAAASAANLAEDFEATFDKRCRAVFHLFDRSGSGRILTRDLGPALRALGQIPSDHEVEMIASKLEQDDIYDKGHTKLSFDVFFRVVQENSERREDIREMVLDSFKALDPEGSGQVAVTRLTSLLTGMGETLGPAEMKELLQEAGVNKEGKVDYIKFIDQLLQFEAVAASSSGHHRSGAATVAAGQQEEPGGGGGEKGKEAKKKKKKKGKKSGKKSGKK